MARDTRNGAPQTSKTTSRAGLKRSTRTSVSYKEDSSEASGEEHMSVWDSEDEIPPPKRQRRAPAPRTNRPQQTAVLISPERKRWNHGRSVSYSDPTKPSNAAGNIYIESDGIIPLWQTLPYAILLEVFTYAFGALRTEDLFGKKARSWALSTACVCKAFTEAALSALYRNPPLFSLSQPHELLKHLATTGKDSFDPSLSYGVKVKRLELEVLFTLAYKCHAHGMLDLGKLVCYLPQLSEIDIYLEDDLNPSHQPSRGATRWQYPDSLFSALERTQQRLKSFRWNFRLFGHRDPLPWMNDIHQIRPFQSLRHITISNFSEPKKKSLTVEGQESLAANCATLPGLESICIHSSPGIRDIFLEKLPQTLQKLRLENCVLISSRGLLSFLEGHGSHLKELVLNYNRSLDLGFLPHLARTAPRLELLKLDMNHNHAIPEFRRPTPLYNILLQSGEMPTWPHTLRTLEMVHLQKWESLEAATHFFQSLIDSAEDLSDLRKLVLKVILDISWRDRADFREKWIPRFRRVFLRKTEPPNPNLASFRAFRRWKYSTSFEQTSAAPGTDTDLSNRDRDMGHGSKLDCVRISPRKESVESAGPSRRTRQSQRIAAIDSNDGERQSEEGEESQNDVTQGMCQVVDILIDNLRPRGEFFKEKDFMDSEVSGDEDWTSENDAVTDDGYAW